MKKIILLAFCLVLIVQNVVFAEEVKKTNPIDKFLGIEETEQSKDIIYQISTLPIHQDFEGDNSVYNIKRLLTAKGDLGIGYTQENSLFLVFNNTIYTIDNNYKARIFNQNEFAKISYGTFKYFISDDIFSVKNIYGIENFSNLINEKIKIKNYFQAIKIKGSFNNLILKGDKDEMEELTLPNAKGYLIAFKMPKFCGQELSKFDFYFISESMDVIGKVKDLNCILAKVYVDTSSEISLLLPQTREFKQKEISCYKPVKNEENVKDKSKSQHQIHDKQKMMESNGDSEPIMDMMDFMPKMSF